MDLMALVSSLETSALRSSMAPTIESWLRKVHRFYSKTFSVPLTEVYELPIDHVISTYFEEQFDNMLEEDKESAVKRLFTSNEQIKEEQEKEESEVDDLIATVMQKALERAKERESKGVPAPEVLLNKEKPQVVTHNKPKRKAPDPSGSHEIDIDFLSLLDGNLSEEDLDHFDPIGGLDTRLKDK